MKSVIDHFFLKMEDLISLSNCYVIPCIYTYTEMLTMTMFDTPDGFDFPFWLQCNCIKIDMPI